MSVLQPTSHGAVTDSVRPPEFSRAERARVLTTTAAGSVVVGYAAVAALLALVSSTAAHASFSTTGVLAAAAPGWLVAHHVPVGFDGGQLGVLPLLPTALVMLLVSRSAAGAADRLGLFEPLQARSVVFSISGAHAAVGGLIAFLMGDEGPVRATPAVAFFGCAAVSGVAAVAGVAQRCGLAEVLFERVDPVARRGLVAGALALFALAAVGALLLAVGLAASWPTTSALFDQGGGTLGAGLGIWLLCLGYLPNAVVGGMSFATGAGFSLGEVVVSPTAFSGGPVPAIPLLAALPEQQLGFLPVVFALPGAIGVLVGLALRTAAEVPATRVRAVLVAAVTAGVGVLVLAAVAGGSLGNGAFTPVTVPAGLAAVLTLVWVGVPGALVAWLTGPRPAAPPPEPAPVVPPVVRVEEDDEYDEDDDEEYEENAEELEEVAEEDEDDYDELDDELDELEALEELEGLEEVPEVDPEEDPEEDPEDGPEGGSGDGPGDGAEDGPEDGPAPEPPLADKPD